jgi:hypothetical protein
MTQNSPKHNEIHYVRKHYAKFTRIHNVLHISTIMYFIMFLVADYLPPSLHTLTCLESAIRSLVVYILVEFFPKEQYLGQPYAVRSLGVDTRNRTLNRPCACSKINFHFVHALRKWLNHADGHEYLRQNILRIRDNIVT